MWQIYSLLSLFTSAIENSIDKMAIIHSEKLDPLVMTFFRVAIFVVIIVLVGLLGIGGELRWLLLDGRIIAFGIFSIALSLSYTYILDKIEITSIATVSYLAPVLFLLIDKFFLKTNLSLYQILGIIFLVVGGIGYSIDGKTFRFKKEISPKILGVLAFLLVYGGMEGYLFKFMNSESGINATTFFANTWLWTTITLLLLIVIKGKIKELIAKPAKLYAIRSIASKSCDVGTSLFFANALTLASVSQVSAMESLAPLVLLIVTIIVQQVMKIHLNERFDRHNMALKIFMVTILLLGGYIVR